MPGLLKLAGEFDLRIVCTNDVHYVQAADAGPHDAMLCIQTGAKIDDEKRMRFDSAQFYLKSRAEMERLFAEVPSSVLNTQAVAEMCELAIPFPKGSERYPKYPLPVSRPGPTRPLPARTVHGRPEEALRRRLHGRPAGGEPRAAPSRSASITSSRSSPRPGFSTTSSSSGISSTGRSRRESRWGRAAARAPAASSRTCSGSPISIPCASSCSSSAS